MAAISKSVSDKISFIVKHGSDMEEYLEFLKLFEIEYDERYVFKPIEQK